MTMHPAGQSKRIQSLSTAQIFSTKQLISPYSVNLSSPIMSFQHFALVLDASTSPISNNGAAIHNRVPLIVQQLSGRPPSAQTSWTKPASIPCLYAMSWTCSSDKPADVNSLNLIQVPDLVLNAAAAVGLAATLCLNRRLCRFTLRQLGWRQQRIQRSWRPPGVW
ncbi:MAG: hypothetical protein ACK5GZ_04755 [Cyanobium sp.]|jgi:hypothetical protein